MYYLALQFAKYIADSQESLDPAADVWLRSLRDFQTWPLNLKRDFLQNFEKSIAF